MVSQGKNQAAAGHPFKISSTTFDQVIPRVYKPLEIFEFQNFDVN